MSIFGSQETLPNFLPPKTMPVGYPKVILELAVLQLCLSDTPKSTRWITPICNRKMMGKSCQQPYRYVPTKARAHNTDRTGHLERVSWPEGSTESLDSLRLVGEILHNCWLKKLDQFDGVPFLSVPAQLWS